MKERIGTRIERFVRRVLRDESGQALIMMAMSLVMLLAFSGFVIDVGHLYYSHQELVASTNAAAMAGAEGLSTSGAAALSDASAYGSQSGSYNHYANLNVTHFNTALACVTAGAGSSVPCVNDGAGNKVNAIQVTQIATVPTYFMRIFGHDSDTISATGTALMRGSQSTPYNIIILIDATGSMATPDTNCPIKSSKGNNGGGYLTRLQCAEQGIQSFLESISPCAAAGCGAVAPTKGDYPNAVDEVAVFAFPPVSSAKMVKRDFNCGNKTPTIGPYVYPSATGTSYSPAAKSATYQITPFMSNYQGVNANGLANGHLNTGRGSDVARAVGAVNGCGISANGSTYYAGAIYAAQAALLAEQSARAANGVQSQNALIITSDGDANAEAPAQAQYYCNWGGNDYCMSTTGLNYNGVYPSDYNECEQAILAAESATRQGTKVFTIAYGSPTTGCVTDTLAGGSVSPCSTIQKMASQLSMFYADNNQSGVNSNCYSPNAVNGLSDIFTNIAGQFTTARLIPNADWP
jgi:Flp pilus assembly protein TadG